MATNPAKYDWAWGASSGGNSVNQSFSVIPNPTKKLARELSAVSASYLCGGIMSDSEYKRCVKELTKGIGEWT